MAFPTRTLFDRRGLGYGLVAGVFGAVLLLLMTRKVIGHVPMYDELLHVLSARGIRESGEPIIAGGEYHRALLFTQLVALSFAAFGDSLISARIPALAAGMCLLVVLGLWTTHRAGWLTGLGTIACLCMVPSTAELAVFARFYTLHALLIVVIAILVYDASMPVRSALLRWAAIACALFLIPLAWHFQETTIIAVGALACGVASVVIYDNWSRVYPYLHKYPARISVGMASALALALWLVFAVGLIDKMGQAPLWNAWGAARPQYYLLGFSESMPLLWPLFPIATAIALAAFPRLSLFCLMVLLSGLAVHSLAAAKSVRYVYYLLPFFAVVWGCAVAGGLQIVGTICEKMRPNRWRYAVCGVLALLAITLVVSVEGQAAAKLVAGRTKAGIFGDLFEPDWRPLVPILNPAFKTSQRVVTSNAMKALYYFGRYDYELNASIVLETETQEEFGRDVRTGGLAISTARSIDNVISMPGVTLVVLEDKKLNVSEGVPSDALAVIERRCTPISLPSKVWVHVWRCST